MKTMKPLTRMIWIYIYRHENIDVYMLLSGEKTMCPLILCGVCVCVRTEKKSEQHNFYSSYFSA